MSCNSDHFRSIDVVISSRLFNSFSSSKTFHTFGIAKSAELAAFECLKKIPIDLLWAKRCFHFLKAVLDQIIFILAGNDYIHKRLDVFEFRSDGTMELLQSYMYLSLSV